MSYLNTRPLIYGFEQGMMAEDIELSFDYPAKIASKLLDQQIDIGLVPVAIIPALHESHIIGDHCIAADGEVYSVCLFSEVPLHEIETVLLDYQSRTSVELVKILMKEHWKISPAYVAAPEGFEKNIKGKTAGLVIGDRAIGLHGHCKYVYDLGAAWKEMTGLPFVFAAWVSNRKIDEKFTTAFNTANAFGLAHLSEVIKKIPVSNFDLLNYYTRHISYVLDGPKRKGLNLFLKMISQNAV